MLSLEAVRGRAIQVFHWAKQPGLRRAVIVMVLFGVIGTAATVVTTDLHINIPIINPKPSSNPVPAAPSTPPASTNSVPNPASPKSATQSSLGTIFWSSDFEGADYASGKLGIPDVWLGTRTGPGSGGVPPLAVVTGNAAHGSAALDVHVGPLDQPAPGDAAKGKNRDELVENIPGPVNPGVARTRSFLGQTAYYRAAFYLPSDSNFNPHNFNITLQFHSDSMGDTPNLRVGFLPTGTNVYQMQVYASGGDLSNDNAPGTDVRQYINNVPGNTWLEVVLGSHWDDRPYQGWVEAYWRPGTSGNWQQIVTRTPVANLYQQNGNVINSYLRIGLYRGNVSEGVPYAGVSHLLIDDLYAGDTLAVVEAAP